MRRAIGLILAAALAVGVAVAAFLSIGADGPGEGQGAVVVRGVIGSEKKPFFDDPRVRAVFRDHGLNVQVDTAGSRQIAESVDLSKYAFAFPAGEAAAVKIKADRKIPTSYTTFYTPLVVASFRPIADLLEGAGIVHDAGGYLTIDVAGFLDLVRRNTRWTDLPHNDVYPASKSILITSTDVRTSNSAGLYLSLASYVANDDNVVQNEDQARDVVQKVAPLFLRQGFVESSSEEPFEDYLAIGIGKTPMVMIYESQYLARVFANDGSIRPDMVLMYPEPDVLSKHTFVPLTSAGDRVGRLLLRDPRLVDLAADYGFRTSDPGPFERRIAAHDVQIPEPLVDLVEPPTYETLEFMITLIEREYVQAQGGTA